MMSTYIELLADYDKLEKQRDELLEELIIASGLIKEICDSKEICRPAFSLQRMDATIKRAKS